MHVTNGSPLSLKTVWIFEVEQDSYRLVRAEKVKNIQFDEEKNIHS